MFKAIYNPTQKICNVPQNLGYDTKSLHSEHFSIIVYCKENSLKKQISFLCIALHCIYQTFSVHPIPKIFWGVKDAMFPILGNTV